MTTKETRGRKLTKLVPHHVLADVHRYVALAIMDSNRVAHKLRKDSRGTRPSLDDFLALGFNSVEHLHHQVLVNEWSLFYRTSHRLLTLCATATNDEFIGRFVLPGLFV